MITVTGEERVEIVRQIGRMNLLAISGGRVTPIQDGIELPVGNGYRVRVHLTAGDDYTVERVFVRSGKVTVKGSMDRVYADQVGEQAYQASSFRSYEYPKP